MTPPRTLLGILVLAAALGGSASPSDPLVWLAGDFHVHTSASHDVCDPRDAPGAAVAGTPDRCGEGPYSLGLDAASRMREAEARGLDFVRITDHNTLAGLPAARAYGGRVTLVPGYEHSLGAAHAGVTTLDLLERGRFGDPADSAAGYNAYAAEVRAAPGGLLVANHPRYGGDSGWLRPGIDWSNIDAIEVWNAHWLYRDDVFHGHVKTSENDEVLEFWTALLDAGHRVAAVGGSDSHWIATSPVAGIGQPTTWVLARANEPAAVVDAVKAGRTAISMDFLGPRVDFRVGDARIGDVIAPGSLAVTIETRGAAGDEVRLVTCRGVEARLRVATEAFAAHVPLHLPAPCWIRVDVVTLDDETGHHRLVHRALTSPIYVR